MENADTATLINALHQHLGSSSCPGLTHRPNMPPRRSNQAASSSQAVSSITTSSRPRFFAGASDINIDARHGVFTNVAASASNVDARYGFINNVAGDMHIVQVC